jgi:hypothetical protein
VIGEDLGGLEGSDENYEMHEWHVAGCTGFSGRCVEEEESACFANFVSIAAAIRSSFRLGWEIVFA